MSDSTGSTKLPEVTRASSPLSSAKGEPPLNAKLIGVPNATEGRGDRVVRIKGEVIQASNEGRVTIKTQSGNIEVQLPPQDPKASNKLTPGQKVEVDIPPEKVRGRTDNTVHIRQDNTREVRAEKQSDVNAEQTTPPKTDAAQTQSQPERSVEIKTLPYTPPTSTAKPIEGVEQKALTNAQGVKAEMQAILNKTTLQLSDGGKLQGVTVRLDPLPADMLTQITTSPPQISINALPASVQALAQSLPIEIESQTMQTLLQTLPAAATTTPPTIIDTLLQQANTQPINTISNQSLSAQNLNQIIQTPITLAANPASGPSLQLIVLDNSTSFSPQKIDIVKRTCKCK